MRERERGRERERSIRKSGHFRPTKVVVIEQNNRNVSTTLDCKSTWLFHSDMLNFWTSAGQKNLQSYTRFKKFFKNVVKQQQQQVRVTVVVDMYKNVWKK